MTRVLASALSLVAFLAAACSGPPEGRLSGEAELWRPLTLDFDGPEVSETAEPNPFLNYRLEVVFTHDGTGREIRVLGFYAADGDAAETSAAEGGVWRARFLPMAEGEWRYRASFRQGEGVALAADPEAGEAGEIDGAEGTFTVSPNDAPTSSFYSKGLLEYVGGHYLRFAGSGQYFLKGGADSPENFLGYADFDQTADTDQHEGVETDTGLFLHRYEPHVGDWREGDPSWQGGKGKGIIGALNYLASEGMNSVYFLTYNLDGGDGKDTWMWTAPDVRDRFDVSKLEQWETVFSHMDRLGIMLHVVTQETENDRALGGDASLNDIRKLYLRELVARFAHHPALIWNLGEENNTPDEDRKAIAGWIRELDPYDHPITVHTKNRRALTFYDGLLGSEVFEATSIQGEVDQVNAETIELRRRSKEAGRPWAIFHDEQTPAGVGVKPDADDPEHDAIRKGALWGNLMGGGSGVEWYFGYQFAHMDLNAEDWRSRANMWRQTRLALEFFRQHLPFWEMEPANELASARGAYVLAKAPDLYAVYLPGGGETRLELPEGRFRVRWFDPRNGGDLQPAGVETVEGGASRRLGRPPAEPRQDWAVLVERE